MTDKKEAVVRGGLDRVAAGGGAVPAARTLESAGAAAEKLVSERYAPPWVVVDADFEVVHLSPRAQPYLKKADGEGMGNLLHLVPEELRPALRGRLGRVMAEGERAVFREVTVGLEEGDVTVDLLVERLEAPDAKESFATVVFEPAAGDRALAAAVPGRVEHLAAVNAELQGAVAELKQANSDMANLIASSEVATLFLDLSLRVKRYTPAMAAILNLDPANLGRPLPHLSGIIDWRDLAADIGKVLETLLPVKREVSAKDDDRHYLMRVLPYLSSEGELDGIVVTMIDLSERKRMEDALLQAKEQWERTFDSVPDLIAIIDDQHRIVRANRAMIERLGVTAEEGLGQMCYHCVHGTEEPLDSCPHALTMKDGRQHSAEIDERHLLNGDFLVTTTPLLDEHGGRIGSVHVARDISEGKRAEEALRQSKQQVEQHLAQLQAILDHLNDGVIIADPDGTLFHWNPAAVAMHDFEDMEQCRRRLPEFADIFQVSTREDGILPLDQWPLARILRGETLHDWEVDVRHRQKEWQRVFSYGGTLVRDKEGKPLLAVLSVTDATLRKRAEESLRQSELQFRTLADAIPQLCWMANADGWIFWYNQRWYQYTGTTAEEMEGWGWQSVHDPRVLPGVLERWQSSIATGTPFDMTFPLRGADGVFRPFLTRVLPVRDRNGKVVRWFGTNTDIAEQSRAEQALHRSNLRLNLLARTAGELLANESPQGAVNSICREVMEFLECHAFFNFLVAPDSRRLRLNACAGISEEEAQRIEWLDYGAAICGCAARDGCRIVAEDVDNSSDPRTELAKSYGIQAYACHPLVAQGRVLGTLSFGTRTRKRFSEEELALMNAVADLVAIAMERKLMVESLRAAHDELEQRVRERTEDLASTVETLQGEILERERAEATLRRLNRLHAVLSEIDQTIVRAVDRESLFRDFCRIAVEHGGFLLAWVGLLDLESGQVRPAAASGATDYLDDVRISAQDEPEGEGPTGHSLREGTYYICNDFQNDPCTRCWHQKGRAYGIRASASIALKEEGRVIGALTLYAGEKDFFDGQHVALLRQMGADISFALDNLLREALRREAEGALQLETLERLQAVEALREKERMLIHQSRQAAMGEMIGNIAHQWRQPLNTLGLMIQELPMRYELGDFDKEYVEGTVDGAMRVIHHMSQTIDDFRNFFRPEKEKVDFRPRKVVDKVISLVEGSLREQRIKLDLRTTGDPLINGYPNEYSQVILNILLNAKDAFSERGVDQPRIEVKLAEEKGRSVVTIKDNAGGIPGTIMDRIFDPYFTTKGPDKGTGVGLYMSKVITEKNMNGRLTARNNQKGAEFRIEV